MEEAAKPHHINVLTKIGRRSAAEWVLQKRTTTQKYQSDSGNYLLHINELYAYVPNNYTKGLNETLKTFVCHRDDQRFPRAAGPNQGILLATGGVIGRRKARGEPYATRPAA